MVSLSEKMNFVNSTEVERYLLMCVFVLKMPEEEYTTFLELIPLMNSCRESEEIINIILKETTSTKQSVEKMKKNLK